MTGTTRESEGRSRSNSTEPWDERPEATAADGASKSNGISGGGSINSKTSETDMVRTDLYVDKTEPLEDGDLPPLSLTRSVSAEMRMALTSNSQKPSEAELNKQRQFWSQLDDSPSLYTSESDNKLQSDKVKRAGNFPDDEMRAEGRESSRKARKSDQMEQVSMADSEDSEDSKDSKDSKEYVVGEHDETNFCDHTLSAMESICGQDFCGGGSSSNAYGKTTQNPNSEQSGGLPRRRSSRQLQLRGENDSVEEHTAIEVEYVEPEDPNGVSQDKPENWSPSRKNAYLAAMARRAKEDFEKSQAKEIAALSPKRRSDNSAAEESTEDVYNTFSASEKRKFLRLINSGLSSTESAERVRAERKEKSKDDKKDAKKGKLFKFWKKGSSKSKEDKDSSAPESPKKQAMNISDDASMERTPHVDEEKKEEDIRTHEQSIEDSAASHAAASDFATASAEDRSTFAGGSSENTMHGSTQESQDVQEETHSVSAEQTRNVDSESNLSKAASQSQIERFRQSLQQAQDKHSLVKTASASLDAPSQSIPKSPSRAQRKRSTDFSDAASQPSVVSPSHSQRSSSLSNTSASSSGNVDANPEETDFEGRFAKSGINYYDAVRRDFSDSEEESDIHTSPSKKSSRTAKIGPIIQSPKLKGFSKLAKGAKADTEADDENVNTQKMDALRQQVAAVVTPENGKRTNEDENQNPVFFAEKSTEYQHRTTHAREYGGSESVASASTSVRGKEREAFEKVEQELLRPVQRTTASRVVSPESVANEHRIDSVFSSKAQKDDDFNMQEYISSTEVYSATGFGNDAMSVMSGKSFSTAETSLHGPASVYTQSSTLTQSSRKRRPGAAKSRLAKAKEADKHATTKQGWHESIRNAAKTTNRDWKPKVGWVDYEEPDSTSNLSVDTSTNDKMHLNLEAVRRSKKRHEEDISIHGAPEETRQTTAQNEWGEEQQGGNAANETVPRTQPSQQPYIRSSTPPRSRVQEKPAPFSLDDMSVEQSVAHSVDQFVKSVELVTQAAPRRREEPSPSRARRIATSPSKRIGWIDSMKAASANVVTDGQSWDPMNGWANVDEAEPDTNDFESRSADPADNSDATTPTSREPLAEDRVSDGPQKIVFKLPSRESGAKKDSAVLEKWSGKDAKSLKTPSPMTVQNNSIDNDYKNGLPQDNSDEVPLLNSSDDFPEGPVDRKVTVDVVREKVDEDDLNWFPKAQPRRTSANASHNASTLSNEQSIYEVNTSMQRSVASSRKSSGPVDVDDVENLDLDSDEDEKGLVWDGVVFETDSVTQGSQANPGSPSRGRQQSGAASKSGSSVTSRSSYNKPVPKLSQNKRDTSPIRAKKTPETSRSAWRDNASASMSANSGFEPSQTSAYEEEHTVTETPHRNNPITQEFEARSAHDDSTAPSTSSSIVKMRAQQWESRTPNDNQNSGSLNGPVSDKNRLNSATAEWKSFLGKKVQAENEAAAREKERMQRGNDRAEPQILYAEDQNDSLFDFSNDGAFPSSPAREWNDAKDKEHRYSKNVKDAAAQAAFSEASSDFSDGNEVNKGFFTRLAGCAAPMLPKRGQNGEMPHLAFLGKNGESASSRFMPQYLCGRPDVIHEEAGEGDGDEPTVSTEGNRTAKSEPNKPQYKHVKTSGSEVTGDTRSVISEDFGAKTAYLEALAMKTAVSKPRKSSSRPRSDRSSSGASETSVGTSKSHKEKWNEFLERKSAAGGSPMKSRASGSEASAAAETYAAKKVEEMMQLMASRSKSTPRSWRSPDEKSASENRFRGRTTAYDFSRSQKPDPASHVANRNQPVQKTDSVAAAEALAAARVNAMMEALANSNNNKHSSMEDMEEGEI